MALLRNRDLSNALFSDNADDEGFLSHWGIRRRRQPKDPNRFPKVPSMEGLGLMRAGAFGVNDYDLRMRKHIARRILERELGVGDGDERRRNSDLVTQVRLAVFHHQDSSITMSSLTLLTGHDTWHEGRTDHSLR